MYWLKIWLASFGETLHDVWGWNIHEGWSPWFAVLHMYRCDSWIVPIVATIIKIFVEGCNCQHDTNDQLSAYSSVHQKVHAVTAVESDVSLLQNVSSKIVEWEVLYDIYYLIFLQTAGGRKLNIWAGADVRIFMYITVRELATVNARRVHKASLVKQPCW